MHDESIRSLFDGYDNAIRFRLQSSPDVLEDAEGYVAWLMRHGNDLARVYDNRGSLRHALGDFAGALEDHNLSVTIREQMRQDDTQKPEDYLLWMMRYGSDLACGYSNRGLLRRVLGDIAGALQDHDAAIDLWEKSRTDANQQDVFADWLAKHGSDLARLYGNRGLLRQTVGDIVGAMVDLDAAIALLSTIVLVADSFELGQLYNTRGGLRITFGDLTASFDDFDEAIRIAERFAPDPSQDPNDYGRWILQYGNDLANAYNNRGKLLEKRCERQRAFADYQAALRLSLALSCGVFAEVDSLRIEVCANCSGLLGLHKEPQRFAAETSRQLILCFELDVQRASPNAQSREANYLRFHTNWLRFTLEQKHYLNISSCLAAIHGKEVVRALLAGLDSANHQTELPDVVRRFKEVRAVLLEHPGVGNRRQDALFSTDKAYAALIEEYYSLRNQVVLIEEYQGLNALSKGFNLRGLRDSLLVDQVLVLFFTLPSLCGALILSSGLPPRWQETSALQQVAADWEGICLLLEEFSQPPPLARRRSRAVLELDEGLWQPLKQALAMMGYPIEQIKLSFVFVGALGFMPFSFGSHGMALLPEQIAHFPDFLLRERTRQGS